MKIMGGPCPDKKIIPIVVMMVWSDELNVYSEPRGFSIIGVETKEYHEVSRIHVWEIHFEGFQGERTSTPWSSVNNCSVGYEPTVINYKLAEFLKINYIDSIDFQKQPIFYQTFLFVRMQSYHPVFAQVYVDMFALIFYKN